MLSIHGSISCWCYFTLDRLLKILEIFPPYISAERQLGKDYTKDRGECVSAGGSRGWW